MHKGFKYYFVGLLILVCSFSSIKLNAQTADFAIGSATNVTTPTITIPIKANQFKNILAWQGSINWYNSKLNFSTVNATIAALNGIQFSNTTVSNTGRLSFFCK